MRRWLLIVMIALLPLRVWAGDVMAAQMLTQQLGATKTVAHSGHQSWTPAHMGTETGGMAHADCLGMTADQHEAHQAPASVDCGTCVACQVCHSVALMVPTLAQTASAAHPGAPVMRVEPFASAVLALGIKPPIS
ncbi:MAG: hypothetical protein AB7I35_09955 [Ramlibacter sp.]